MRAPGRAIIVEGKVVAIAGGLGRSARCSTPGCTRRPELVCDWPVLRRRTRGTCDRPVCSSCAFNRAPGVDYCRAHGREHQR